MAETGTWGKIKEGAKVAGSLRNGWATTAGFRGVITWAVICDLLSSIPWVGLIFTGLGYSSIWLTLEIKGVSAGLFGSTKRMASFAAEWIAGAFGFGIVPGITAWTYFCIAEHKAEQQEEEPEENNNEKAKESQGGKASGQIEPQKKQRQKRSAYMKDAA
jgi:hypothetical protein